MQDARIDYENVKTFYYAWVSYVIILMIQLNYFQIYL